MDIIFRKFTDFNRGIMYDILKDAYSFDERCAICWEENWKETDDFFRGITCITEFSCNSIFVEEYVV